MSIETDWQIKEYAQDIHLHLRSKERKRLFYMQQSPQLSIRKCLVEYLSAVCEKMEFCNSVQHLAVYLLDVFMDNHTINNNHFRLVTLGCLLVAVKLEERDCLIPTNSCYNALIGNKYSLTEFVQMELTILQFFHWNILFPTAAHFAEYYVLHAFSSEDCCKDGVLSNIDTLTLYFRKYLDYFLETSLQDTVFLKFYPSVVAASCILTSRLCLGLNPPWPVCLQRITYYKYAELKPCVEILLRVINSEVLKNRVVQLCNLSPSSKSSDSISESSDCMLDS